jgi:hypothetical protein
MRKRVATKKILLASLGVGAVSYIAACGSSNTPASGNLVPPSLDASADANPVTQDAAPDVVTSGNLMGPPPVDSGTDASAEDASLTDGSSDADVAEVSVGNLMPPPVDSGK